VGSFARLVTLRSPLADPSATHLLLFRHSHGGIGSRSAHKPFCPSRASFSRFPSTVSAGAYFRQTRWGRHRRLLGEARPGPDAGSVAPATVRAWVDGNVTTRLGPRSFRTGGVSICHVPSVSCTTTPRYKAVRARDRIRCSKTPRGRRKAVTLAPQGDALRDTRRSGRPTCWWTRGDWTHADDASGAAARRSCAHVSAMQAAEATKGAATTVPGHAEAGPFGAHTTAARHETHTRQPPSPKPDRATREERGYVYSGLTKERKQTR
jgi:hypothetical protein